MFSIDNVLDELYPHHKPGERAVRMLKRLLHEQDFQQFAHDYRHLKGLDMVEQVLEHLQIQCDIPARDLEQIPGHGPLVVVANHPTGTADGLLLLYAISRVRRDIKVVANRILSQLEPLSSLFIAVDNMNNQVRKSAVTEMDNHLAAGGVLIFFPAGEVARWRPEGISDRPWSAGFIKLARRYQAPILPVRIQARNSALFYLTSLISPGLSLLLLIREMFRLRGSRLPVRVGERIPWDGWQATQPARELAARFREHVHELGKRGTGYFRTEKGIAPAEDRQTLRQALSQAECLGNAPDGKRIYLWRRNGAEETPILRELGRLREIAFRAVGEGTGKRRDVDAWDDDYWHLVLWDDDALEIVGAYRFMPGKDALKQRGYTGLYSHSLFDYQQEMEPILAQGIELGRSFIQPRYWGRRGLDYLWYGIGAWLARNPDYRYLFGPVSISGGMPLAARHLLVAFYRLWFAPVCPLGVSRRPWPSSLPEVLGEFTGTDYQQDLAHLKQRLNNLGCGIPPLYKQYSELCEPGGVQFIDFGSDPDFNDCIDGLVLVDLTYLKSSKYQRYIGTHLPQDA